VTDAVLLVAFSVRRLRAKQGRKQIRDAPARMITNRTLGLESRSSTEVLVKDQDVSPCEQNCFHLTSNIKAADMLRI